MALEKFHYVVGKKKIVLPKFKDAATFGFMRRARSLPEHEQMIELIESVADEKTLAILDPMGSDELEAFISAWQEDSSVTLGESSAS